MLHPIKNRKEYEKNCKKFGFEPLSEKEFFANLEWLRKQIELNDCKLTGSISEGDSMTRKGSLIEIFFAEKDDNEVISVRRITPRLMLLLGMNHHIDNKGITSLQFYVKGMNFNKLDKVIENISEIIFGDSYRIKKYLI